MDILNTDASHPSEKPRLGKILTRQVRDWKKPAANDCCVREKSEISVRLVSGKLFPGQYYDAETGKHYNYFRDYNPMTGRYVESDPIGVVLYRNMAVRNLSQLGLVNDEAIAQMYQSIPVYNQPYTYVRGNPLLRFDAFGLADFLDRCEGRYESCKITQYQDASTVGNWLRYKVCEKAIDQACSRTGLTCCEEDHRACLAKAAGDTAEIAKCEVNSMQCMRDAGK